ncbi:MAG: Rne/Rng family ribonuclease [Elusimicrobia bacterium]|nr:Rne/Rng family ribonuclease [Elusimicrobiota bacterium]
MSKVEIVANSSAEETRIALIEDGRLAEFFWERKSASSQFLVGNIYCGRVANVLPGMDAAFVNIGYEKNAYLYITDVLIQDRGKPIDHILKKDQKVMVQVIKDTIGTKGMKITMNVNIPGRYLVLTPYQRQVHVSKHLEDPGEHERLAEAVTSALPAHIGAIVRTEAEGVSSEEIKREAKYLMKLWDTIHKKFEHADGPRLLYKELDLAHQVARDILSEDVAVYLVDSPQVYRDLEAFVEEVAPHLKNRLMLYNKRPPIFGAFGIETELVKMLRTHIPLKSGGVIVVQEAESITMIDVNTARFVGATTQEETVTQTNIEAAQEVARQLRLRNIGGIIVIDFIDMRREVNRRKVLEAFRQALKNDRAKVKIHPITKLGLVEMTRERKRESNVVFLTDACETCQGSGRVLSKETLLLKVGRELGNLLEGRAVNAVRINVPPPMARYLKENQQRFEGALNGKASRIAIQEDMNLPWEEYKIVLE